MTEYAALVEWYWHAKSEVFRQKPVPVPLCPTQISHGLAWNWTCFYNCHLSHGMANSVLQTPWTINLPVWMWCVNDSTICNIWYIQHFHLPSDSWIIIKNTNIWLYWTSQCHFTNNDTQWRTQELFSGGVQQIQLRTDNRENGDLGAVAP